jgi:hypothetical protein
MREGDSFAASRPSAGATRSGDPSGWLAFVPHASLVVHLAGSTGSVTRSSVAGLELRDVRKGLGAGGSF